MSKQSIDVLLASKQSDLFRSFSSASPFLSGVIYSTQARVRARESLR